MSESGKVKELASFVGQSKLTSDDPTLRREALNALASGLKPRLQRRGVADLLGVVLVLSARTRRLTLPTVDIDLDVFTPDGRRAVRMHLGH